MFVILHILCNIFLHILFIIYIYTYICMYNLCLNEKLAIIDDPDKNLLNKRSEVISQCRHRNKFKLVNLTSCKTPNDVI